MKKTILTLMTTVIGLSVYSQSLNIVFDGDSQTSSGTWPLKIIDMLTASNYSSVRYINFAVSGQTTSQMVSDVNAQVVPRYNDSYDENIVLYYVGYNDTWAGSSLDVTTMYNRLVNYYNTLKTAGFKVLMVNLPDGYNRLGISRYNNMYASMYGDICDAYVNCRQTGGVFEDYTNTLYYRDNVHLSTTGLNYLAENFIYPKLMDLIDSPAPSEPPVTDLLTGLESYYKFDETSTMVKDETGANHATASSYTTKVTGRSGNAWFFDSNSDYITLSKKYSYKTATYTFWMKISSITDDLLLMADDAYYSRIFIGANNNLKIETNTNGQEFAFYSPFNANTWYHIALVRNNDNVTIYRNGIAAGTAAIGSSNHLSISQIGFNGRSFRGTIDEVGIWSRALTPSQVWSVYEGVYPFSSGNMPVNIPVSGVTLSSAATVLLPGGTVSLTAAITPENATNKTLGWSSDNPSIAAVSSTGVVKAISAGIARITVTTQDGAFSSVCTVTVSEQNPTPGTGGQGNTLLTSLRAYYKFDEASGNAKDEAGINTGIVSSYVGRVPGRINGGYYFDSNSDYIALSSPITHKSATYSFWMKLLSITDDLLILGNNPYYSRIFIGANNNIKLETNTNGQEFAFYNSFNTGVWYHISLVRNNDQLLFYRNGVLTGSTSIANSDQMTISQIGLNGRSFRGILDEVGIWDRALSAQEVAQLSSGLSYPFNAQKSTAPADEAMPESVKFYPNPASDRLYFTSPALADIYDLQGKLLLHQTVAGMIVDISGLEKGLYLIRISHNKMITTHKLIVR